AALPPTPATTAPASAAPLAAAAHPSDAQLLELPDAVPRAEPRARLGNPPFYEVFGQRYTVLADSRGYVERGVASWYGPDFHGARTSTGEPYDMYTMTAAHRTLQLPAYARVTNLSNGRSVVVRINDRGPFKANRIIDLSYAAALRLDIVRDGTSLVEVQALEPEGAAPPPPRAAELYAQAGAFAVEANAARLRERLLVGGIGNVFLHSDAGNERPLYRVRIGPIDTVAAFDALVARLKTLGIGTIALVPN
ncbi:MAG TPA: septal ring lytic transglycosylase RlpA family protein, partial [Steroidobacteraceae bacterium]|nr:septal ring lytic transglycosylase RlpA family protein [Steroidobacteraceae bacterium]